MAILIPSMDKICSLPPAATPGELFALEQLEKTLDDTYEIYFQPVINGYKPDIIVLKKEYGVFIFEIKDWNLSCYEITPFKYWLLKKDNSKIISPFEQVQRYKKRLYDLSIDQLLVRNIKNTKTFGIVKLAVLFFCSEQKELARRFQDVAQKYPKNKRAFNNALKFLNPIGFDSFNRAGLMKMFESSGFLRKNVLFDNDLYSNFARYLKPSLDIEEAYQPIRLSKKQKDILDKSNKKIKVTGFAGSGKTTILAKKVVEFLVSHPSLTREPDILIFHYNVTIKNMLEQKIKIFLREESLQNPEVSGELLKRVEIQTYHSFFARLIEFHLHLEFKQWPQSLQLIVMEQFGAQPPSQIDDWPSELKRIFFDYYYNNPFFFKRSKYLALFIDEVQDLKKIWVENILGNIDFEYYYVFGDEHQNLYHQEMEDAKRPYTGIPGSWFELKDTFRLPDRFAMMAYKFQEKFLSGKYRNFIPDSQRGLFCKEHFLYMKIEENDIGRYIFDYLHKSGKNPNDVTILSQKTDLLKKVEFYLFFEKKIKTTSTFESSFGERFLIWKHASTYQSTDIEKIKSQFDIEKIKSQFDVKKINDMIMESFRNEKLNDFFEKFKNILNEEKDLNGIHFKSDIEKIRKSKKFHFYPFSGKVKISTVSSFKGWESETVFLLLDFSLKEDINNELYFTAITRCKGNLIIINLGNENDLTSFFYTFK